MAEILPIQRKTLSNQLINQSMNQSIGGEMVCEVDDSIYVSNMWGWGSRKGVDPVYSMHLYHLNSEFVIY